MATQEVKLKVKVEAEGAPKVSAEIDDIGESAKSATQETEDLSTSLLNGYIPIE